MTVGVRIRDRLTNAILLEITDRLTRTVGSFNTGTSPGSINVPAFSAAPGWACMLEAPDPTNNQTTLYRFPRITINGTTLSWDFPGQGAEPIACQVEYGVY